MPSLSIRKIPGTLKQVMVLTMTVGVTMNGRNTHRILTTFRLCLKINPMLPMVTSRFLRNALRPGWITLLARKGMEVSLPQKSTPGISRSFSLARLKRVLKCQPVKVPGLLSGVLAPDSLILRGQPLEKSILWKCSVLITVPIKTDCSLFTGSRLMGKVTDNTLQVPRSSMPVNFTFLNRNGVKTEL